MGTESTQAEGQLELNFRLLRIEVRCFSLQKGERLLPERYSLLVALGLSEFLGLLQALFKGHS